MSLIVTSFILAVQIRNESFTVSNSGKLTYVKSFCKFQTATKCHSMVGSCFCQLKPFTPTISGAVSCSFHQIDLMDETNKRISIRAAMRLKRKQSSEPNAFTDLSKTEIDLWLAKPFQSKIVNELIAGWVSCSNGKPNKMLCRSTVDYCPCW